MSENIHERRSVVLTVRRVDKLRFHRAVHLCCSDQSSLALALEEVENQRKLNRRFPSLRIGHANSSIVVDKGCHFGSTRDFLYIFDTNWEARALILVRRGLLSALDGTPIHLVPCTPKQVIWRELLCLLPPEKTDLY